MGKAIDDFLERFEQLIINANNRNRELSGELTFIRERDCDVDLRFAKTLEIQAYRVHGELLAYEKVQKLCETLVKQSKEEDEDDLSY
jgi:hypothetical protein